MGPDQILERFARLGPLPEQAILAGREQVDELAPRVVDLLRDAIARAQRLPDADARRLFYAINLMAEFGRTDIFRSLLDFIAKDFLHVYCVFGDSLTYHLDSILISVADSREPLFAFARDRVDAEDQVRAAALAAWSYHATFDDIETGAARNALLELYKHLQPNRDDHLIGAWIACAATFGLSDLAPNVRRLLARTHDELPDETIDTFTIKLAVHGRGGRGAVLEHRDLWPFDDMIETYRDWASFRPGASSEPEEGDIASPHKRAIGDPLDPVPEDLFEQDEPQVPDPVRNPYRDVGRNDPCPCGSGKKFKKCCGA